MKKYKTTIIVALTILALIVNLILIDLYILPKKIVSDNIIGYNEITKQIGSRFGRSQSNIGYTFFTKKNFKFSTEQTFINNNIIEIEYTSLFNNITSVKTKSDDYSSKLISDLNGINLYLYIILATSTIVSLLVLLYNKNIDDNGFYNVILFNLFIIFSVILLYINFN